VAAVPAEPKDAEVQEFIDYLDSKMDNLELWLGQMAARAASWVNPWSSQQHTGIVTTEKKVS